MAQRNDQVFQLSLTEIAFTISFILLLLLGYLVFKEQSERLDAEQKLALVQSSESAAAALEVAKNTLETALRKVDGSHPQDVITKLIAADEIRVERDRLKQQIDDINAKLTALTELKTQLENAAKEAGNDVTLEQVESALVLQQKILKSIEAEDARQESKNELVRKLSKQDKARQNEEALDKVAQALSTTAELKNQLKKQLGKDLPKGKEAETLEAIFASAKSYAELSSGGINLATVKKENSDLRGQVAFLKNRLDARGGRDYPPCWADESGRVQFLFAIETKADVVVVAPAWPAIREAAARALPGIGDVLAAPHSHREFVSSIQGIFNWSKKQDPECRHYVQLKSSISDAIQSDRARLMVENYFYKVEARR